MQHLFPIALPLLIRATKAISHAIINVILKAILKAILIIEEKADISLYNLTYCYGFLFFYQGCPLRKFRHLVKNFLMAAPKTSRFFLKNCHQG